MKKKSPAAERKRSPRVLEIEDLRLRLEEAEETLRAIRRGEVDGLIVEGARGKQMYTLKGADESYRTLVEAMAEGALIVGRDGVILYANRRFGEIVRTPLQRVIGARVDQFVAGEFQKAVAAVVEQTREDRVERELLLRRSDGSPLPVKLSAGAMRLEERECVGILVTDLSEQRANEAARAAERKLAEDDIRRHASALEATNVELESFVYSVSHDLRAPLRSVHRFAALVREEHDGVLDGRAKDHLDRVMAAAVRMDDLIRDLLSYSRVSRQEISLGPVETASVVSDVLKGLSDELKERGAEIVVKEPLPAVVGDALLLSQAMSNLVSNAIKFVAPGVQPRVSLRAERRGPAVRLWVEDNGIGIADAGRDRVFQLFERHHPEYPGTGVGLAIVRRAVERMGGAVGVESREGEGSRFWIELRPLGSDVP